MTVENQRRLPLVWLWKLILKLLTMVKGLLTNLSNYPGLGFLRSPADRLGSFLSDYYTLQEKRDHIEQDLANSKQKAAELRRAVTPRGKRTSSEDSSRPPEQIAGNPSSEGGLSTRGAGKHAWRRGCCATTISSHARSEGHVDARRVHAGIRGTAGSQAALDGSSGRTEQQAGPEHAKPAYYGTLMPPDRARTVEPQQLGVANPQAMEPLFTDTVRVESAVHDTAAVLPAQPLKGQGEAEPQVASAPQWMTPSRSNLPRKRATSLPGRGRLFRRCPTGWLRLNPGKPRHLVKIGRVRRHPQRSHPQCTSRHVHRHRRPGLLPPPFPPAMQTTRIVSPNTLRAIGCGDVGRRPAGDDSARRARAATCPIGICMPIVADADNPFAR